MTRYIVKAGSRYLLVFHSQGGVPSVSLYFTDPRSSLLASKPLESPVDFSEHNVNSAIADLFVELLATATRDGRIYYPGEYATTIIEGWLNANPGSRMEFTQGPHGMIQLINGEEKRFGYSIEDIVHRKEYKFSLEHWPAMQVSQSEAVC